MQPSTRNALRSLRVAVVASSLRLAGAEKQTYYMARALHEAGADARVFYLGHGGFYDTGLRESGVPVHQVYSPNRPWRMLAGLIVRLVRLRPHIVLAAQFGDLLFAAPAGRFCGALVLGGVRSDGLYELNAHPRHHPWMIAGAHRLVANSRRAKLNLASHGVEASKIELLSNVIDLQEFDAGSTLPVEVPLPQGRILAAAVGTLQPGKRFDRFLEALALARRREPALAGLIAGADGGALADLQARATVLGLGPGDVVFAGKVSRVPALLARTAMLVLTSDFEGFPNVLLEAMAARRPVISTPVGDASLIVRQGQTGFVVPPDDTEGLATLLVQLAQDASMRLLLGEAGRRQVEQEHDYERLSARLIELFHRVARELRRGFLCKLLDRPECRPTPSLASQAIALGGRNGEEVIGKAAAVVTRRTKTELLHGFPPPLAAGCNPNRRLPKGG